MRRTASLTLAVMLLTVLGAIPASADIDTNNPNLSEFGPVWCEDGTVFELVRSPTFQSPTGHSDAGVGVAKSIWVVSPTDGPTQPIPLVQLWKRPGKGLDSMTIFCWWEDETPTGWIGGEILPTGQLR